MLQELLNKHCMDPKNPNKIFDLAKEYDRLEQGAMAVSLYLKAADLTEDKLLQYKCMIGIGNCYWRQGNRTYTVEGAFQDAAALIPERPEAHYFLAGLCAERQLWKASYLHAKLARLFNVSDDIDVGYKGRKASAVQEAIAKWYITGTQEGKHALFDLKFKSVLDDELYNKVNTLLTGIFYPDTIPYSVKDRERFKYPFPGFDTIQKNYSKHFQDLFVLSVLNGKRNGTYLEIGSGDPFVHNNTALLETEFGWKGISIDNQGSLCYNFKENRNNTIICADATEIGYADLFDKHCMEPVIDYLQIDCDELSVDILEKIPFNQYGFRVITFEHDKYRLGDEIRDKAREHLRQFGYIPLVNDVAFTEECSYEDWYVHPALVDIPEKMKTDKSVNFVWEYFMKTLTKENERKL
jgi:hypothetical protein